MPLTLEFNKPVSGAFTGSLLGTASYAASASFVSGAYTAQWAPSASYATTALKANVAPAVINLNNTFGADVYITQIPAAITEWDDGQRQIFDLTNYTQARMAVRITSASIAGCTVNTQYSADNAATWNSMSVDLNGPSASLAAVGTIAGPWFAINSASQADVQLRWTTFNGDSVTGVKLGSIALHVK